VHNPKVWRINKIIVTIVVVQYMKGINEMSEKCWSTISQTNNSHALKNTGNAKVPVSVNHES
jgi:hypothetical protein